MLVSMEATQLSYFSLMEFYYFLFMGYFSLASSHTNFPPQFSEIVEI